MRTMKPLSTFSLLAFFSLPACFAIWYFLSILFVAPLASILDASMTTWMTPVIAQIEQDGNRILVILQLVDPGSGQEETSTALMKFYVHPLDYSYGVPLYSSLLIASPGVPRTKILKWTAGVCILFTVSVLAMATLIIKAILFDTSPALVMQLGWPSWTTRPVEFSYNFSYLILTPVAPIAIWTVQFRNKLQLLVGVERSTPRE